MLTAILLAAGTGSRLKENTSDRPKALVEAGGATLVEHQLTMLAKFPFNRIVVVGGCGFDQLNPVVRHHPADAVLLENKSFLKANLLTLRSAREFLKGSVVMMNVDHLYPSRVVEKIIAHTDDIYALVDFDRPLGDDDMKIKLNDQRRIQAISKKLTDYDGGYCGMTLIGEARMADYQAALDHVIRNRGDDAVVEEVLQALVNNGDGPALCDISGIRWLEIDTPAELNDARRVLRMIPDFLA